MPDDRSWVAFTLTPEARWHDGKPVTAEDVIFSFETLSRTRGSRSIAPTTRTCAKAEQAGERRVKFTFDETSNRELPLILGAAADPAQALLRGARVRPDHAGAAARQRPVPDQVVRAGAQHRLRAGPDYWGADLPVNRGPNNFDQMRYEYYRDANVALEAFKAGDYDIRLENTAKFWATAYTGPLFEPAGS